MAAMSGRRAGSSLSNVVNRGACAANLACAVLKSSRTSASTDGGGCLMEDPGAPAAPVVDAPDAEVPDVVEVDVDPEPEPDS